MKSHGTFRRRMSAVSLTTACLGLVGSPAWAADEVAVAPPNAQADLERNQPWRAQISAPLYGTGNGGARVVVGVADTGVDASHPELRNRVLMGRNLYAGNADYTDQVGHGTHVTGLIAGRMSDGTSLAGLAPNATVAIARVFGDTGSTTSDVVDRGIRWLVDVARAPIINLSLGSTSPGDSAALAYAVRRGTLIVAAAGNGGGASPGWPAAFATQPWAAGQIIAVGSVDSQNRISTFSNRAGDARYYYVVAPGENIASSYSDGRYATMSGTSMATPMVAAQAALIKGTWRYLSADRIAQVIFRSATDLGAPGVDAIYGWGLINVERSMQPIGALNVMVLDRGAVKLTSTSTAQSAAPATMGVTGGGGAIRTQAFDETGRNFEVRPGAALARSTPLSLDTVFGPSDRMLAAASAVLAPGVRMTTITDSPRMPVIPVTIDPYVLPTTTVRAMALTYNESIANGGRMIAAGTGGMASYSFGVAASPLGEELTGTEQALGSPLLRFAGNHDHVAFGMPLAPGWVVRAGGASSRTPFVPAQGTVGLLEVVRETATSVLSFGYSALEQPSVLGATQPLLGFAQDSRTQALSLAAAHRLADGFALATSFSVARTDALHAGGNGSLFAGGTATRSSSFGIALVRSGIYRDRDRLSLSLSSPLRAENGNLQYNVVSAVDPDTGAATSGTQTVSARPNGRERLAELRYALPMSKRSMMQFSLAARFQPDHDAEAASQRLLAVRYLASF